MDYEIKDINEKCVYLLKKIEESQRKYSQTKIQLNKLKKVSLKKASIKTEEEYIEEEKEDNNHFKEEDFEDEIMFYKQGLIGLDKNFTKEDLYELLPKRKHYNYKFIIYRLILESIKEKKELLECFYEEENLTEEDSIEYKSLIDNETRKINFLKEAILEKDNQIIEEAPNKIILAPTSAGNIRVVDELEHVPIEYYERFRELLSSIIDGTFKNVKCFTNNNALTGIYEVKAFAARVVFTRIGKDSYAIITAFIKKTDYDKAYAESLKSKVLDFKKNQAKIKSLLNNEDFIKENDKQVEYLFELLSNDNKNNHIKGGLYE